MLSYKKRNLFLNLFGKIWVQYRKIFYESKKHFVTIRSTKKKGGKRLIEKETKIITHGEVDAKNLGEEEQRAFYISLLARILDLYRKEKGKEVN